MEMASPTNHEPQPDSPLGLTPNRTKAEDSQTQDSSRLSTLRWSEQSGSLCAESLLAKTQLISDATPMANHSTAINKPADNPSDSIFDSEILADNSQGGTESGDSIGLESPAKVSAKPTHEPTVTFVHSTSATPSLGAWAKPLSILPLPESSAISSHSRSKIPSTETWPSLKTSSHLQGKKKFRDTERAQKFKDVLQGSQKSPVGKFEDDIRFPWAAKMNPSTRNLYRAIEPDFLEDGTPKVTIPKHILLQGLENQKEYILGQFYRCLPPPAGGMIFAVFNKIWGRNCKITISKLGESTYIFHIPDASTRSWVLERGLWHVDDCLMFVAPWAPEASLDIPEIKTIPVWVTLKKIPNILYSIPGISHIASGLGAPMATHKPRLDPILMGEAKILVEVELSKAFPARIAACDENGFISMVDVEYAWLPTKCGTCGQLGHKDKRCLQSAKSSSVEAASTSTNQPTTSCAPVSVSVVANDLAAEKISKDAFVDAPISDEAVPGEKSVDNPVAVSEETLEAAPAVTSDLEVLTTNTTESSQPIFEANASLQLAVTNEAVSTEIKAAIITDVISTSSFITSTSGHILHSPKEFEFGATNENNQLGTLESLDASSSDSDSQYETMFGTRSKRGRLVKPSIKKQDLDWTNVQRGRGNRGRGDRGGRGGRRGRG